MAKIIQIESTRCPCCDTELGAIEPIDGSPEFGTVPVSITICDYCGHLMMVQHDLTLREPSSGKEKRGPKIFFATIGVPFANVIKTNNCRICRSCIPSA